MGTTKTLTLHVLPFGFAVAASRWVVAVGTDKGRVFVVGIKPLMFGIVPCPSRTSVTMQIFGYQPLQ